LFLVDQLLFSRDQIYERVKYVFGPSKGLFGSRVLEGRGGEIYNLKCLVQFLEGEGREEEGSKSF